MLHLKYVKIGLIASTILLLSNPAIAQENNNEFKAILECKTIESSTERLSCYDLAAGRLDVAQQNGDIVAISKDDIETVERDAFGFNIPSLPNLFGLGKSSKTDKANLKQSKSKQNPLTAPLESSKPVESIKSAEVPPPKTQSIKPTSTLDTLERSQVKEVTLDIQRTAEFGRGKTRFFLSNGQVWEQTNAERIRIPKVRGGQVNQVKITKASFGTFNLRINGKGRATKVKRVR